MATVTVCSKCIYEKEKTKNLIFVARSHFLTNYKCIYEKELRTKNLYTKMLAVRISGQWGGMVIFIFCFLSGISMYYFYNQV